MREPASWQELRLGPPWQRVVEILAAGAAPRPIQCVALGEQRLLEHRRNVIVAAPTNAGKSLVGLLALLEAIRRGRRAVLLEPLRAVANERCDELRAARRPLAEVLGGTFRVRITTGDYRLEAETFASPPPSRGELIVATPERFEAILRNPANGAWIDSVGCVCVDEAHLISSPRRGLTLEYLLTALRCVAAPPRLILLSASLGELDRAQQWLSPCDVARVTERFPRLQKEVREVAEGAADEAVCRHAEDVLRDPAAGLLVFVYQTRSAEKLARHLQDVLGERAGCDGPLAYHGQIIASRRRAVRQAFLSGRSRCLVTTTALGLGVNLPASHVVVRDTTFPGVGRLSVADLLQMMGRAGRGEQEGHAVALVRPRDGWSAGELTAALREERLPGLVSCLDQRRAALPCASTAASPILAQLLRHEERGQSAEEMTAFFAESLGGRALARQVGGLLAWLCDPARCLAYRDEQGRYHPTVLGQRAAQAMLPLDFAAGAAQLVRDLLSADDNDVHLSGWQNIDHLILIELLRPHSLAARRFSEPLAELVDGRVGESLLYREWIRGDAGSSRAAELLGSLGITTGGREVAYLAVLRATLLAERSAGRDCAELERRWGVSGFEGVEERWRDEVLWLLSGWARILEVRCFYHHLREGCGADGGRIRRVKSAFRRMRAGAYEVRRTAARASRRG
jgi:superfamily II DNA/RNA helicase